MKDKKKKEKLSFVCRSVEGCGYFQNRTNWKLVERKIKREGLSRNALLHFGHATQDSNGFITFK